MYTSTELSWVAPQNFYLVVERLPEIMFTVQQVTLPTITADTVVMSNKFNPGKTMLPGEGVDFAELTVSFIIDKEFLNYKSILRWIKANANPQVEGKLKPWESVGSQDILRQSHYFSNLTVVGTDAGNTPLTHWNFNHAFPTSLSGPLFDSTQPDVEYLKCDVTFHYHYFEFGNYNNGVFDHDSVI